MRAEESETVRRSSVRVCHQHPTMPDRAPDVGRLSLSLISWWRVQLLFVAACANNNRALRPARPHSSALPCLLLDGKYAAHASQVAACMPLLRVAWHVPTAASRIIHQSSPGSMFLVAGRTLLIPHEALLSRRRCALHGMCSRAASRITLASHTHLHMHGDSMCVAHP